MAMGVGIQKNIDSEQLIEAVRSFPCLRELSSKDYKDSRDNAGRVFQSELEGPKNSAPRNGKILNMCVS